MPENVRRGPSGPDAIYLDSRYDIRAKGAPCDGVNDCAEAIRQTLADMASSNPKIVGGGILFFPRGTVIDSTSVIDKLSPVVYGEGWGLSPDIQWGGLGSIPMVQLTDCYGVAIRDLWLCGKQSVPGEDPNLPNRPSAILNLYRLATHTVGTNGQFRLEHLFLGMPKWYLNANGFGADIYADVGLLVDGTNGNNDEIHVVSSVFRQVGIGASFPNSQSIWTSLADCLFDACSITGLSTAANMECDNLSFNRNAIDIQTIDTARFILNGYQAENSSKLLHIGESSLVVIRGGTVAIGAIVGGEFISSDPCKRYTANTVPHIQTLVIEDVIFRGSNGTDTMRIRPAAGEDIGELIPAVILRNIRGLTLPAQLDIDPVDAFDARRLIIDCEGIQVNRVLRWPETAAEAIANTLPNPPPGGPAAAIADGADPTVNAMLAQMRAMEQIEWPANPDSALLGDCVGWWSAERQAVAAGTSVASETDYSGNGRDSVQALVARQPIARGVGAASYNEYDGIDDGTVAGLVAAWPCLHGETWEFDAVFRLPVLAVGTMFATWNGASAAADRGLAIDSLGATGVIRVRTRSNNVTTSLSTPAGALVAGTWHSLRTWRQKGVLTIAVDGVIQATLAGMPDPGVAANPSGPLTTGSLTNGSALIAVDVAAKATHSKAFTRHQLAAIQYRLDALRAGL